MSKLGGKQCGYSWNTPTERAAFLATVHSLKGLTKNGLLGVQFPRVASKERTLTFEFSLLTLAKDYDHA